MTELITNGNFLTALTGWNQGAGGAISREDSPSYKSGGSAKLVEAAASGTCYIDQQPTTPTTESWWRLSFALQASTLPDPEALGTAWCRAVITATGSGDTELDEVPIVSTVDEWHRFSYDVFLPASTQYTVRFYAHLDATSFFFDEISLVSLPPDSGSCEDLAWELAGLRFDRAMVKHPQVRYEAVINQAIREAPRDVWPTAVDTSLVTVDDQRRYALSGITDLVYPDQVRTIWTEDEDDGHYYQRGRYHVENDEGTLTLVLHEDPEAADLTIKVEYYAEPATLDCTDTTDTTSLDRDWLIAKAMTLLWLEADPQTEDPMIQAAQLNTWDLKRQQREAQLRPHHRTRRLAVTRKWH